MKTPRRPPQARRSKVAIDTLGKLVDHGILSYCLRALFAGAAVAWVAAMVLHDVLDNTYVNYPRVPNPEIGRTVPYEVKRVVVYVTNNQRAVLDWLRWIEIGSGALIVISLVVNQNSPLRSNDGPSKSADPASLLV